MKHSIATHLLDASADLAFVKDWLGHVNIQNTTIYGCDSKPILAEPNARARSIMYRFSNMRDQYDISAKSYCVVRLLRKMLMRFSWFIVLLTTLFFGIGCTAIAVPTPQVPVISSNPSAPEVRVALYILREKIRQENQVWEFDYRGGDRKLKIVLDKPFIEALIVMLRTQFPTLKLYTLRPVADTYDLILIPDFVAELQGEQRGNGASIELDVGVKIVARDAKGEEVATFLGRGRGSDAVQNLWERTTSFSTTSGDPVVWWHLTKMGKAVSDAALNSALRQLAKGLAESVELQTYVSSMRKLAK